LRPQGELAEVVFSERPVRPGGLVEREGARDMHLERACLDQAVELGDRPSIDADVELRAEPDAAIRARSAPSRRRSAMDSPCIGRRRRSTA
jgi:hypothetical protein